MLNEFVTYLLPLIILAVYIFLIFRFHFFTDGKIDGRYAFVFGGLFIIGVAFWQILKLNSAYDNWFITSAYPIIDLIQTVVLIIGVILTVVGLALYSDFWQSRQENIDFRERKLSILDNLQQDARQPYQLLDLLDISLKEILLHLDGCCGAVFMVNRPRRQFILTTSSGLSREETAYLEYYPYQRNILSQAVELGDPVITPGFEFYTREGKPVVSKYKSTLILPMVSGVEKIGGIILFSEEVKFFDREDIKYLNPVADWLSEKIRSARLHRELTTFREQQEARESELQDLLSRMLSVAAAFSARDALSAFTRELVGLAGSKSVHLCGIRNGLLQFYGGSEPLLNLSENYRTALINAIDRNKPLIINQESGGNGGQSRIVHSNLVYPLTNDNSDALLFRREDPFKISDDALKIIGLFAHLARLILSRHELDRLDLTRRLGFEKIIQLIGEKNGEAGFEDNPGEFVGYFEDILPVSSRALTFVLNNGGIFTATEGFRISRDKYENLEIMAADLLTGDSSESHTGLFLYGKKAVARRLDSLEQDQRQYFNEIFGENGLPVFMAVCPIYRNENLIGLVALFMYELEEIDSGEWQRLLTLAGGLYSLRQTIMTLKQQQVRQELAGRDTEQLGSLVNQLNNHLAAVMGMADLAQGKDSITGEIKSIFGNIRNETEKAGTLIKNYLGRVEYTEDRTTDEGSPDLLKTVLGKLLDNWRISGDLYMVSGRPREVHIDFNETPPLGVESDDIQLLFEAALNRFATLTADDEVISLRVYQRDDYIFIDITRHRKNYPAPGEVSDYGDFKNPENSERSWPGVEYLKMSGNKDSRFAVDPSGQIPAYLSFKFPVKSIAPVEMPPAEESKRPLPGKKLKILAIDDEAVILDLISAMGQSLGSRVQTAKTGTEGLRLAMTNRFDIVLTDLAMPDISGYDVARKIHQVYPDMPIILVTGWEARLDKARLEETGIREVLYKPFRIEQLTEIIETAAQKLV